MSTLIDWDQLGAIADGWPPDFVEIFDEFLVELPDDLNDLKAAIEAHDVALAASLAHRVKGCAANFGFQGVREAALTIESAAKAGSIDGLTEWLDNAVAAFDAGVLEVEQVRAGSGQPSAQ